MTYVVEQIAEAFGGPTPAPIRTPRVPDGTETDALEILLSSVQSHVSALNDMLVFRSVNGQDPPEDDNWSDLIVANLTNGDMDEWGSVGKSAFSALDYETKGQFVWAEVRDFADAGVYNLVFAPYTADNRIDQGITIRDIGGDYKHAFFFMPRGPDEGAGQDRLRISYFPETVSGAPAPQLRTHRIGLLVRYGDLP